jgi:hypothetical protein
MNKYEAAGISMVRISNRLLTNQTLIRLLKDTSREVLQNGNTYKIEQVLGTNIILEPFVDDSKDQESKVVVRLPQFNRLDDNTNYLLNLIAFDVYCPKGTWGIDANAQRPYLIMKEIDQMFEGYKLNGIGTVTSQGAELVVPYDELAGFSMVYGSIEQN